MCVCVNCFCVVCSVWCVVCGVCGVCGVCACVCVLCVSVRLSVQEGIYALRKAHMRSTPSLGSFPNVAFETVPETVPVKLIIISSCCAACAFV